MSLRRNPVTEIAMLPDGRRAIVWVGIPDDPYIPKRELDTVALELRIDEQVAAALNTVLDPEQDSEARALAREVAARLESGELEPTAGAIEPFAETLR